MTFEQDYNKLLKCAKYHIFDKQIYVSPEDLVHNVFIEYSDSGEQYNFIKACGKILHQAFTIYNLKVQKIKFDDWVNRYYKYFPLERICKKCQEQKASCAFRIIFHEGFPPTLANDCRECDKNERRERYKNSPEFYQKHKDAMKRRAIERFHKLKNDDEFMKRKREIDKEYRKRKRAKIKVNSLSALKEIFMAA